MPARTWGTEKLVNTATLGNQLPSDMTALPHGGFVVFWQDDITTVADDAVIRAQRFDALGNKVGGKKHFAACPRPSSCVDQMS